MCEGRHHQGGNTAKNKSGSRHAPRAESRSLHHCHLALAHQFVCDPDSGAKGRDRENHPHEVRQGECCKLKKNQRRLTIANQRFKQDHGPIDPEHGHQNQGEEAEEQ